MDKNKSINETNNNNKAVYKYHRLKAHKNITDCSFWDYELDYFYKHFGLNFTSNRLRICTDYLKLLYEVLYSNTFNPYGRYVTKI